MTLLVKDTKSMARTQRLFRGPGLELRAKTVDSSNCTPRLQLESTKNPWAFKRPFLIVGSGLALAGFSCAPPSGVVSVRATPAVSNVSAISGQTSASVIQPQAGAAVISGSLTFSPLCRPNTTQLVLMAGNQTVYQTHVAPNSTYELHVNPGTYLLFAQTHATSPTGQVTGTAAGVCGTQVPVTAVAQQALQINLFLAPGSNPSSVGQGATPASPTPLVAGGTTPQAPYYQSPMGTTLPPLNYAAPYPAPQGAIPCPWYGYGCAPQPYPGTGGALVGKPNVYISAAPGTQIALQVRPVGSANLLAAVPAHGLSGWSFTQGVEKIEIGGAKADFLFYDYRFNPNLLQARDGFCLAPRQALDAMLQILEANGFQPKERADFQSAWSGRLPRAPKLCVYPQRESELAQISELVIQPPADELTRIWFLIVPSTPLVEHQQKNSKLGVDFPTSALAFKKAIDKPFVLANFRRPTRPASSPTQLLADKPKVTGRSPASVSPTEDSKGNTPSSQRLHVREWGVGFLIHAPENKTP
jgi:hypothetical protein